MKGLLKKDIIFMLKNKKMIFILLVIEAVFLLMQGADSASFVIAYMGMGCMSLVLYTITADESDKSIEFLMAMPVGRKEYALEKYLFFLLCTLSGCLVAVIPCCLINPERAGEFLSMAVVFLAAILILQMVVLPVQLKYGGERGRIVLMGIFAFIVLLMALVKKSGILEKREELQTLLARISNAISGMDRQIAGIGVILAGIVCFGISLTISQNIMEKKEF